MESNFSIHRSIAGALLVALMGWAGPGHAQLNGQASAVTAAVAGTVTSLADSGTLASAGEPVGTATSAGSIGGMVSGEALTATSMGWPDQVVSQASLGNLSMSVLGTGITATSIVSTAKAVSGAGGTGQTSIDGLTIGGLSVVPSGVPNQVISLPGLNVILNEQIATANGIVVNALRVVSLDGLTNIIVGSARAGI